MSTLGYHFQATGGFSTQRPCYICLSEAVLTWEVFEDEETMAKWACGDCLMETMALDNSEIYKL